MEKRPEVTPDMRSVWRQQHAVLKNTLTQDMVADIRQWRVGDGPDDENTYSWRQIATMFVEKYPEYSAKMRITSDNQYEGMQLCDVAMELLHQKVEEGWN